MSEAVLKAGKRPAKKKRANALLRGEGKIPAIVYGKDEENIDISVDVKEFMKLVDSGARMIKLDLEGTEKSVLIKDIQYGTYDHIILHADFRAVNENTIVHVSVSIELEGTAKGDEEGGVVSQDLHEVSVECKAKDIPSEIVVDISELAIGDSIHVEDVKVPEGVKLDEDPQALVVACNLPMEEPEESEEEGMLEGEESLEPEVIGEKSDEDEGTAGEKQEG